MTRFTQQGVERLKVPPKPQRYDKIHTITRGLGLALRVSYSGSKIWRVLYYINGKPHTETLGKFPEVSVSEAYKKARKFDPEAAGKKAAVGTFKQVAEDYVANHVDQAGLRSKPEIVRCLTKYVYPTLGNTPFIKVRRGDVMSLRDDIEEQARQAAGQRGAHHPVGADELVRASGTRTTSARWSEACDSRRRTRDRVLTADEMQNGVECLRRHVRRHRQGAAADRAAPREGRLDEMGGRGRWRVDHSQ